MMGRIKAARELAKAGPGMIPGMKGLKGMPGMFPGGKGSTATQSVKSQFKQRKKKR
jgi:hypothetical protein